MLSSTHVSPKDDPAWGLRWGLGPHVAALALVMAALLPVIGWHGVFSSDEGAAIAQAKALSEHGSFTIPHPFPEADPAGVAFPLEKSARTGDGYAPLPKKPAYVMLLAGVDEIAGLPGMVAVSIAGTIGAALASAVLARRLAPSLTVVTFWITGLASPLFTDGFLVIAHTLGAAACGGAILLALRLRERVTPAGIVGFVVLLGAGAALRAEAVLFGVALALGLGVVAWRRSERRSGMIALVGFSATALGWVLDRELTAVAFGSSQGLPAAGSSDGDGMVVERVRGFLTTWLRPGYGHPRTASVLVVALAVLGVLTVGALRRRHRDERVVRVMAALLMALAFAIALTLSVTDPQIVPGLLLAFPAMAWGLLSLRSETLGNPSAQILGITAACFALAVLATQYAVGGAWEWGGRYFAVGLPCATPLVAAGLRDAGRRLTHPTRTLGATAVVAASLAMSVMGVASVRDLHDGWSRFVRAVAAASMTTEAGDGGTPVVVTTERELPRAAWDQMDSARWLLVPGAGVPAMLDRLGGLGIEELTFVTKGPGLEGSIDASPYLLEGPEPSPRDPDDWWIATLMLRPGQRAQR